MAKNYLSQIYVRGAAKGRATQRSVDYRQLSRGVRMPQMTTGEVMLSNAVAT